MDRSTPYRNGSLFPVSIAASTMIYAGHLICANAAGFSVPAASTAGLTMLGVSDENVDNRDGAAGDKQVIVRRGVAFLFNNASASPVTQAHVGKPCFVSDSTTVCATGDVTAGTVLMIGSDGVWVLI